MSGGIAPFSLTSARSAKAHAAAILTMTQLGMMPPWPPPGLAAVRRQRATDPDRGREGTIARWVRDGARIGRADDQAGRTGSSAPGTDLSLVPARSYTRTPPAAASTITTAPSSSPI
jgi:hypothetical protein